MSALERWARAAVGRKPVPADYQGLSYSDASRRAVAVCAAAAETGQTINARLHLEHLHDVMEATRPHIAA